MATKESSSSPTPNDNRASPRPVSTSATSSSATRATPTTNASRGAPGAGTSTSSVRSATSRARIEREDLEFGRVLGYGSYSRVVLATHRTSNEQYAVKIVSKQQILAENKVHHVMNEKNILRTLRHVNIIQLISTFQTHDELFYVLECAENGELLNYIQKMGHFDVTVTRRVTAELVNALEYLHSKNVVHRDVKPENILFDKFYHVKLVDFGTAQLSTEEPVPLEELRRSSSSGLDPDLDHPPTTAESLDARCQSDAGGGVSHLSGGDGVPAELRAVKSEPRGYGAGGGVGGGGGFGTPTAPQHDHSQTGRKGGGASSEGAMGAVGAGGGHLGQGGDMPVAGGAVSLGTGLAQGQQQHTNVTASSSTPAPKGRATTVQSFCGTAQYVSPELLSSCTTTYSSDLWALGCIVFQMQTGKRPFQDSSDYLTFRRIMERDVRYPPDFPPDCKDLCDNLMVLNPCARLGVGPGGFKQLKAHPFFNGIDFIAILTDPHVVDWTPRPYASNATTGNGPGKPNLPRWVPDEEVDKCHACKHYFTFFIRKHHCRVCGNVFCNSCSSKTTIVPWMNYTSAVRVCNECHSAVKRRLQAEAEYRELYGDTNAYTALC